MNSERTELEWTFDPPDLFEATFRYEASDFSFLVQAGRAVATLNVPTDPVSCAWDRQFEADVAAGRLDQLAEEVLQDLREGRCTDL